MVQDISGATMQENFTAMQLNDDGTFAGTRTRRGGIPYNFSARFDLFLIAEAWDREVNFEDLADGFGPNEGTHGDWSAIRDSSDAARTAMFQRALNFFF